MKPPPLSAIDTMPRDLGWALAWLARDMSLPAVVDNHSVDNLNRLLKPAVIRKIMRHECEIVIAALIGRGYKLVHYADRGGPRGIEFTIDAAD